MATIKCAHDVILGGDCVECNTPDARALRYAEAHPDLSTPPAHTPGPWIVAEPKDSMSGAWEILDEESASMKIAVLTEGENHAEFLGNAILIASAPDLLAALSDLRDAVTDAYKMGRIPAEPFVRAGNVIAVAEGR